MSFQRMVVIPQNEYLQLTALQEAKHPIAQQFFNAEQKYENAAGIHDPYTRLMVRGENLEQMKALKDDMRNYISLATPKPYRSRAERLLSVLEPHITWNERGELIDSSSKRPIERSQVSDLIQHAVRDRRRNISPTGWKYFLTKLHEHNIPQMLLNLSTLDELKTPVRKSSSPFFPSRIPRPATTTIRRRRTRSADRARVSESNILSKETPRNRKLPTRLRTDFLTSYRL